MGAAHNPKRELTENHGLCPPADLEVERCSGSCTDRQTVFCHRAADVIRLFTVLSGFVSFSDSDRERTYAFANNLMQMFPGLREELPLEAVEAIDRHRLPTSATS